MKKRVLCYTDFSENALNAIEYAIKLYEQQASVFYLLNAFQAGNNASDIEALVPDSGNAIYEAEKKASEAGLKNIIDTLKSNPKHTYKTISNFNALLFALKETIVKNKIDLLVIGSKNALNEVEVKNIPTLDIMEYITECSILVVPSDHKFCGLKEIVLPINYEETLNEADFSEVCDIAKLYHADINILQLKKEHHLDDNQLENKKILESILKGLKYSFHTLERMNVNKGIHLFVENEVCNLIVFIEEKSSYIGNELPRPLLKELEEYLPIPVLAVNRKISK